MYIDKITQTHTCVQALMEQRAGRSSSGSSPSTWRCPLPLLLCAPLGTCKIRQAEKTLMEDLLSVNIMRAFKHYISAQKLRL